MRKFYLLLISVALIGCSSGPYPEIKKGSWVSVRFNGGGGTMGKVWSKNADSLTLGYETAEKVIPWTTIEQVTIQP